MKPRSPQQRMREPAPSLIMQCQSTATRASQPDEFQTQLSPPRAIRESHISYWGSESMSKVSSPRVSVPPLPLDMRKGGLSSLSGHLERHWFYFSGGSGLFLHNWPAARYPNLISKANESYFSLRCKFPISNHSPLCTFN